MGSKNNLSKLDCLCWFLSRHRLGVLLVILAVTGVFLYGAFRIQGEVILQEMLPYDHPFKCAREGNVRPEGFHGKAGKPAFPVPEERPDLMEEKVPVGEPKCE